MHLEGKTAVVTGAGRGIGQAIAISLAAEGAAVVVNDLGADVEGKSAADESPAHETVEQIVWAGGQAVANVDSVATFEGAGRAVGAAVEHFGRLDILVNVAGNARRGTIFSMDPVDWRDHLGVHLDGTFYTCRHAAPLMREQGGGRIINTGSNSFVGSWGAPGYSAAKAGIYGLTRAIATEGRSSGITANCLAPEAQTRLQDFGRSVYTSPRASVKAEWHDWDAVPGPEFVGPLAAFLASDGAAAITGCLFTVRGARIALWSEPQEAWDLPGAGDRGTPWAFDELAAALPALVALKP